MPSDQSTWLITVPQDGDSEGLLQELTLKLSQQSKTFPSSSIGQLYIPSFKTGTLDSLIALSEELPKHDATFTNTVAKVVETLRNLLNNDPSKLAQHILVNEKSVDGYLLNDWQWNEGRYGTQRGLKDMTDILVKARAQTYSPICEMTSIDNVMKTKLNNYNLAKGSLVQLQRKKTGNLSVRSLADIVSKGDLLQDSEYMQSVLVAVPRNLVKNWSSSYERLATMVVPRSAAPIASDDDYTLYSVVIFRKVYDMFSQKCRENKYVLRDFQYSVDQIEKEREELQTADTAEKELWTELLRLSEINFSEAFQVFVHLKVVRLYVESVLRYGLPANYVGIAVKPEPKTTKRTLTALQRHFSYLSARSQGRAKVKRGDSTNEDFVGEYQSLLDQELFDFVLYEVPWIVT
ncbi:ATPase V1 complex subunit C [Lactarius quietus]|nr:ATPase V1 complex subunit C [Lactarius quietus]